MRIWFLSFLFVLAFSLLSTAQTAFTLGGSVSTMLIPPSFKVDGTPIGIGGFGKFFWQTGPYDFKFIEAGGESFKFIWDDSGREFTWNYLRLTFGQRNFFFGDNGFYVEYSVGFHGFVSSGYRRKERPYPGAGAGFGLGFSGKVLSVGLNLNGSFNTGIGGVINPMLYLGLNLQGAKKNFEEKK